MNDFLSFEITDWMQEDLHLKEGNLVLYAILFFRRQRCAG